MIKVGDLVKVVKNAETSIVESMGMLKTHWTGEVVNERDTGFDVIIHDCNLEDFVMWFPESWLEKIDDTEVEDTENNGVEVTIKYDKESGLIDIEYDVGVMDLTDKESLTLYNLVDALYDLLEIE